jgi:DNA-binding transcriptional ArsR family regulator
MDVDEFTVLERVRAVAVLVGEPARAVMLWSLLEGRSKPASELAFHANVSAQSASGHLAKLLGAGLLAVERRGRHRFYKLANAEVATAVESIATLMPRDHVPRLPSRQTPMLRYARSCYDHLAGSLGVEITEALQRKRWLLPEGKRYLVTPSGIRGLATIGIDLGAIQPPRRALTRQCLDWSERRPHLAGAVGAALLKALLAAKWLARVRDTRVLRVTNEGRRELNAMFGLSL